ncbi:MAG: YfiR family protein [Pseudomonadota bacterium]
MPTIYKPVREVLAVLVTAWLACVAGTAQAQHAPENQLKAALIFNFALFTEWPQAYLADGEALSLCVAKHSLVSEALVDLEQKSVNGHPLRIKFLSEGESWQNCRVAYLENDAHSKLPPAGRKFDGQSVLTISDRPAAVDEGIMIAIAVENSRFVFDINATAARQAKLNISSKLLRLARKVY